MRTGPDLLVTVGCSDGELDLPPVDFRHLGLPGDQASDRRRCEMAHVDRRADRAVSVSPQRDRVEPDAIPGEFKGHRPGQRRDAALACYVMPPDGNRAAPKAMLMIKIK